MTASENRITWHVLSQPLAQDVTITYADGTSYTARYVGSSAKRHDSLDGSYSHITLSFIHELDAEINKPGDAP